MPAKFGQRPTQQFILTQSSVVAQDSAEDVNTYDTHMYCANWSKNMLKLGDGIYVRYD